MKRTMGEQPRFKIGDRVIQKGKLVDHEIPTWSKVIGIRARGADHFEYELEGAPRSCRECELYADIAEYFMAMMENLNKYVRGLEK